MDLFIDGAWRSGTGGDLEVLSPATEMVVSRQGIATKQDIDDALNSAERAFKIWRCTSPLQRSGILRKAAQYLRERVADIAECITTEQGKPSAEAKLEVSAAADMLDWCAEEGRRVYGRVIPARSPDIAQKVIREPIGPVMAFSPWNFPVSLMVRKIAPVLASGCTLVIKPPEECPGACKAVCQAFADAGLPNGVLNMLFGIPDEVASLAITDRRIQKITFTGSTRVGREIAKLSAQGPKPCVLELGGHAPFIVMPSADVEKAAAWAAFMKFRNAGQVCVSPSRFFVHRSVFEQFVASFVRAANAIVVGDGMDDGTEMGPVATRNQLMRASQLVQDALSRGAEVCCGGKRLGETGYFFSPTVLSKVPLDALIMVQEPFVPVAPVLPFDNLSEALEHANSLSTGLAGYAFTDTLSEAHRIERDLQVGMLSINAGPLGIPETPFGGVKLAGYGREGGTEGLEEYCSTRIIVSKLQ